MPLFSFSERAIERPLKFLPASAATPVRLETPAVIDFPHWQEMEQSGINPQLTALNIETVRGDRVYEFLCNENLSRRNDWRLRDGDLKRYAPLVHAVQQIPSAHNASRPESGWFLQRSHSGGWAFQGLDVETLEPFSVVCFKPDYPRRSQEGKLIKYETPLKTPTQAYLPRIPASIAQQIVRKYQHIAPCPGDKYPVVASPQAECPWFWQWVKDHPQLPLYVTEGVKKTLNLLSRGFIPLGLQSVTAWNNPGTSQLKDCLLSLLPPDRPITIAFDQDLKPKTVHYVNGQIWKFCRALQLNGCEPLVATWDPAQGKGVDDVADGAYLIDRLESAAPFREWHQDLTQKQITQITGVETRTLNQPLLTPELLKTDKKLILIKSGKGTGKTKALCQLIREAQQDSEPQRFVWLTPSTQLSGQSADRAGLPFINTDKEAMAYEGKYFGHVSCIHSFRKHGQLGRYMHEDLFVGTNFVLDEVDQILWALINPNNTTMKSKDNQRLDIMQTLTEKTRQAIATGGQVFALSADLNGVELDLLLGITGVTKEEVLVVENIYQPAEQKQAHLLETPEELWKLVEQLRHEGKRLYICSTAQQAKSKFGTHNLEQMWRSKFPGDQTLRVDSTTTGTKEHPASGLLVGSGDIDQKIADINPQAMIVSPTLQTGISLEQVGQFDAVILFDSGNIPVNTVLQMIERYRPHVPVYISTPQRGQNGGLIGGGYESPRQILESVHKITQAHLNCLRKAGEVLGDFEIESIGTHWLNAYGRYASLHNSGVYRHRQTIVTGLKASGYNVQEMSLTIDIPAVRQEVKTMAIASHLAECEAQAQAAEIDRATAQSLAEQPIKTLAEQQSLAKHKIAERYGVEVTPELIDQDSQGWYSQLLLHYLLTVGNIWMATQDQRTIDQLTIPQVEPGGVATGKFTAYTPDLAIHLHAASVKVLELLNIQQFLNPDKTWTSQDLAEWGDFVKKYTQDIKRYLGVTINPKDQPIAIAQLLLAKLGLKLTFLYKRGVRGQQQRIYQMLPQTLEDGRGAIFAFWLQRDQERFLKLSTETAI